MTCRDKHVIAWKYFEIGRRDNVKKKTMEFSYKNNIKILMLIFLWLLADLVLQQIHSCEFFIIEFSEGLNSYDCISISVL